jgi:hypothetical protein
VMVSLDEVLDKDEVSRGTKGGADVVKVGHGRPDTVDHEFFPRAIRDDPKVRKGAMRGEGSLDVSRKEVLNDLLKRSGFIQVDLLQRGKGDAKIAVACPPDTCAREEAAGGR